MTEEKLPPLILVINELSGRMNPGEAFHIRDAREKTVHIIQLSNQFLVLNAKNEAIRRGFPVTHWMSAASRRLIEFK